MVTVALRSVFSFPHLSNPFSTFDEVDFKVNLRRSGHSIKFLGGFSHSETLTVVSEKCTLYAYRWPGIMVSQFRLEPYALSDYASSSRLLSSRKAHKLGI